ncbi:unnamed protein product [Ambrosiozyma monospora]|uniref:Unnamed protein product n=1 Tax=Ambrosiozyma monospora TaxID=43982 RepID=A0A9W7DK72_AMBMO|nr:unnamed protein product [Ambrosiozyma monospora]
MAIHSREITHVEEYFLQRNLNEIEGSFQISATYSIDLTPEIVFDALVQLLYQYCQWSLQCYPSSTAARKYEIKLLKEYRLRDVLEFKSSDDVPFEELLMSLEFRMKRLANDKPLWGLIVYDSRTLILWSEHILGDGTSFKNFHIEFLKFLNGSANGTNEVNASYDGLDSVIFKDQWFESRDISPDQKPNLNQLLKT